MDHVEKTAMMKVVFNLELELAKFTVYADQVLDTEGRVQIFREIRYIQQATHNIRGLVSNIPITDDL